MFADALIAELKSYTSIAGYVSPYLSSPAVFSRSAPDNAVFPYIIVRINMADGGSTIIDSGNLYIDLYEENSSDANQIAVATDILNKLDRKTLSNTIYSNIRFFRSSWDSVSESRSMFKHYNIQFECRAIRKLWNQSNF
ncbi:MAG: hypothetical protein JW915_23635 [Chitinispirillaceae bacterium]|nr:hypothetical protein [Chitinispirillaceae bacterium]